MGFTSVIFLFLFVPVSIILYYLMIMLEKCTFRINGAPFPRQRCKRLAPAVRYPFVVTC